MSSTCTRAAWPLRPRSRLTAPTSSRRSGLDLPGGIGGALSSGRHPATEVEGWDRPSGHEVSTSAPQVECDARTSPRPPPRRRRDPTAGGRDPAAGGRDPTAACARPAPASDRPTLASGWLAVPSAWRPRPRPRPRRRPGPLWPPGGSPCRLLAPRRLPGVAAVCHPVSGVRSRVGVAEVWWGSRPRHGSVDLARGRLDATATRARHQGGVGPGPDGPGPDGSQRGAAPRTTH